MNSLFALTTTKSSPPAGGPSSGTDGEQEQQHTSSVLDELIRQRVGRTTSEGEALPLGGNVGARRVSQGQDTTMMETLGDANHGEEEGKHSVATQTTPRYSMDRADRQGISTFQENPMLQKRPYGTITTNDGVELFYEHFGSSKQADNVAKPVVVLIHGWSGSRHYWDLNVRLIARHCKVVTFDLRHHGDSEKPNVGYHVARLASDLRDLLVALRLSNVTVVGASMGASIIWSYFELFGIDGRIGKAVFVDQAPLQNVAPDWRGGSTGCYDIQSLTRLQCRLLEDFKGFARDNAQFCSTSVVPEDVLAVLESETLRASNVALAALMADHTALDWRPVLPRITIPCLNIIGKKSTVFPYWGCEEVSRLLPNCRTVYFENENHWLYIEQPDRFSKIVSLFARHGFDAFVTRDMPGLERDKNT